jgi:hypothetical protein
VSKSDVVQAVDEVQRKLRPALKERGFSVRGRTFNRTTSDGLTQVINLQTGSSDPPGTTYIPGLRVNVYGLFTVNLGVYVPEVAALHGGGPAKSWVQDYNCQVRERLGNASGSAHDVWWAAEATPEVIDDVKSRLLSFGTTFLDRFGTRDLILSELAGQGSNLEYCATPRIVCAIILLHRGKPDDARKLMAAQAEESTHNKHHPAYVRQLAERMGLGVQ